MGAVECGITYEFVSRFVCSNPYLMVGETGARVEEWVRDRIVAHEGWLEHAPAGPQLALIARLLRVYLGV